LGVVGTATSIADAYARRTKWDHFGITLGGIRVNLIRLFVGLSTSAYLLALLYSDDRNYPNGLFVGMWMVSLVPPMLCFETAK
jgi:hypothetical protein